MNILYFGDIYGRPGRRALAQTLPHLIKQYKADAVFVNAENAADGRGVSATVWTELQQLPVDYFTSGDHIWDQKDFIPLLDQKQNRILRPLNYPKAAPGRGWADVAVGKATVRLINVIGRVFTKSETLDSQFARVEEGLKDAPKIIIVDHHAEATSEKHALAYHLDGRISLVVGTHTHVQTNDARILPKGTGYITDLGMCGPLESVIGEAPQNIIEHFVVGLPFAHDVAKGDAVICGICATIDEKTGKTIKIEPIRQIIKNPAGQDRS